MQWQSNTFALDASESSSSTRLEQRKKVAKEMAESIMKDWEGRIEKEDLTFTLPKKKAA